MVIKLLRINSETHISSCGDSVGSTSPEPGALVPVIGVGELVNPDEVSAANVVSIKTIMWNKISYLLLL